LERWWEVGRYGCQNDGLGELDIMVEKKRREGGREGGRERGRVYLGFTDVLARDDDVGSKLTAFVHLGQRSDDGHENRDRDTKLGAVPRQSQSVVTGRSCHDTSLFLCFDGKQLINFIPFCEK